MQGMTVALRTFHITSLGQILDNGCQQILVSNQSPAYIITYSIRMQPVAKLPWEHKDCYYFSPEPSHLPECLYLHSIVKAIETVNTLQPGQMAPFHPYQITKQLCIVILPSNFNATTELAKKKKKETCWLNSSSTKFRILQYIFLNCAFRRLVKISQCG